MGLGSRDAFGDTKKGEGPFLSLEIEEGEAHTVTANLTSSPMFPSPADAACVRLFKASQYPWPGVHLSPVLRAGLGRAGRRERAVATLSR